MRICAVFVNNCDRFKVYSEYAAFYLRFQHRRHEDIQLQHKLAELNPSGDQSSSIDSLLIKPIQRVLRYPLFLSQIKENCAADSKEYKHSAQALSRVQTLATYVNEMQRIYEEYGAEIDRISRCTEVKQMGLQITLHELFMFAQLKCLPPKEKTFFDCVAFIFTGCILLLPQMKKKEMVSFCHVLPIWEVQITASTAAANQSAAHQFTIVRTSTGCKSLYEMSCCHADIKTQFVKSARKALTAYQ
ncbi:RhoGEF domain-containing protein [Aphelenchoides avenae]|nr:RhoGEF domain-containing protein [Aphelenchus avenae]